MQTLMLWDGETKRHAVSLQQLYEFRVLVCCSCKQRCHAW